MENRKILITGATGGIGSAIARKLVGENATLFLHYHSVEEKLKLEKELAGKSVRFFKADLTNNREIGNMMKEISKIGNIDIVVHCASLPIKEGETIEKAWKQFQDHIQIQAGALLEITKKAIPAMKAKKRGKIINVLSEVVTGRPPSRMTDYIVGKYALLGLSKCLAVEYSEFNITCNCVSPGLTDTNLTASFPKKLKENIASQTPLGRICTPEDVAAVVSFLCSNASDFVNGENIRVNGGYLMG